MFSEIMRSNHSENSQCNAVRCNDRIVASDPLGRVTIIRCVNVTCFPGASRHVHLHQEIVTAPFRSAIAPKRAHHPDPDDKSELKRTKLQ